MQHAVLGDYMKAQGAIESKSASIAGTLLAQGATEYLVLLAVVLIVALVSVALLGFFPGMASDAQITQSKAYWASAQPIAITDVGGRALVGSGATYPYLFFRNSGAYQIRVTGIIGADGGKVTQFYDDGAAGCLASGGHNISDYYYMAPGEEKYFASPTYHGGSYCRRHIVFSTGSTSDWTVGGASSVCQNSSSSPGMINFNTFGFEYIEYIDGQQITKRQIGVKPLIAKCREP